MTKTKILAEWLWQCMDANEPSRHAVIKRGETLVLAREYADMEGRRYWVERCSAADNDEIGQLLRIAAAADMPTLIRHS